MIYIYSNGSLGVTLVLQSSFNLTAVERAELVYYIASTVVGASVYVPSQGQADVISSYIYVNTLDDEAYRCKYTFSFLERC